MLNFLSTKKSLKKVPEKPGIYIFKNQYDQPIYVGKAVNLKNRLNSYFSSELLPKTAQMINEAKKVSLTQTNSEMDALILEANLVRKYLPKYNSQLRDDKSPLYIIITGEKYPRVKLIRKSNLSLYKLKSYFGPFTSSLAVKKLLKSLRKIIPFSEHLPNRFSCIYSQINLCNPCPSVIENTQDPNFKKILQKKYQMNIFYLKKALAGSLSSLKKLLFKKMLAYSQKQFYEKALEIKKEIELIDNLAKPFWEAEDYLKNPNFLEDIRQQEIGELLTILQKYFKISKLNRIECYDISHFAGSHVVASMVTFIKGDPEKALYRRYKIDNKLTDDTQRIKALLQRRSLKFSKTEWGQPDLIIIDGGKPQVSAALAVLKNKVPVVGLAKRYEIIVIKDKRQFIEIKGRTGPALHLIQRLRDESHRFAQAYHHKLVAKEFSRAFSENF